jgi:riboflavin synthase
MFTGLIETVGSVISIRPEGDVWRLDVAAPKISAELSIGDSVCVSGACNTVVRRDADSFSVEMMEETRKRTKLGSLKPGARVNLERAMRLDARLDGHLVAGHVDGLAELTKIEAQPRTRKYYFKASAEILAGIVEKGSVCIDGVSLTVIDATGGFFSVGIIPTTLADTSLAELKVGDSVNIETDMIGKYVLKFLNEKFSENDKSEMKNSLTWDKLVEYGWA